MNYYEALGISKGATPTEIDAAFEKQKHAASISVYKAYWWLSDSKRRSEYDGILEREGLAELDRERKKLEQRQTAEAIAIQEERFARARERSARIWNFFDDLDSFFRILGICIMWLLIVVGVVLVIWVIVSGLQWLWNHPLF